MATISPKENPNNQKNTFGQPPAGPSHVRARLVHLCQGLFVSWWAVDQKLGHRAWKRNSWAAALRFSGCFLLWFFGFFFFWGWSFLLGVFLVVCFLFVKAFGGFLRFLQAVINDFRGLLSVCGLFDALKCQGPPPTLSGPLSIFYQI